MMLNRKVIFWTVLVVVLLLASAPVLPSSPVRNHNIIINEFVAANATGLTDADGESSDWIEITNRGYSPVNLAGWSLTDDENNPQKWPFPEITLDSGAYLVVFASGKNRSQGSELHTNFKLDNNGEFLGLYNTLEQAWIDTISPAPQYYDTGYSDELAGGQLAYLTPPSPGEPNRNSERWQGRVEPVQFNWPAGLYDQPMTVELSSPTANAIIFYTLDGSEPNQDNGIRYNRPIPIDQTTLVRAIAMRPEFMPSPGTSHSYIFFDTVRSQPNTPPPGFLPFDYEMDPEIVNHPQYKEGLREALTAIPSLSLVTAPENFDIYANPRERGREWERPVSVEYIPVTGEGFQINAGLRIQGGFGRWEVIPKHSFRLFFRSEYGAATLDFPLFPGAPVDRFNTLVLRGGVNRSYAGKMGGQYLDPHLATYTRDEWLRASQIAVSGTGSRGIFVHLYLDGMYWGLYNLVERPDAAFMSAYLGGQKEEWSVANHGGVINGPDAKLDNLLHQLIGLGDLPPAERLAVIEPFIDIEQLIDTIILNFYAGNQDWSDSNWYVGYRNPNGKLQFFIWDAEVTWQNGADIEFVDEADPARLNLYSPAFKALIENDDFRLRFADRLYRHLHHDGPLTDAAAQARWQEISQPLQQAIIAESARWGDTRFETPVTQADWLAANADVLAQMDGNAARLIHLTRKRGYYPQIDPPQFQQQGGQVTAGFTVTLTISPNVAIYYSTTAVEPRLPQTGEIAPQAKRYTGPIVITETSHLLARGLDEATLEWSALNAATFTISEPQHQLHVSEIMYHPADDGDLEFVELINVGDSALAVAGISIEGIGYTFPPNAAPLAAGQRLVLVHNPGLFAQHYPGIPLGDRYSGRLSNSGETLVIKDSDGTVLSTVTFDDENGWPLSPDGQGDSLVRINFNSDPNDPKSWRSSSHGGSPGQDTPEAAP